MSFFTGHPLVRLWLYLILSIAILLSPSIAHWIFYSLILFLLIIHERVTIHRIARSLLSFFYFIPLMVAFYFIISIFISSSSLLQIGKEIGITIMKFMLVMATMNLYVMGAGNHSVFHALRSIWAKLNRPWKRVEDWFLYLEMTMRFYPTFQREWSRMQSTHKALGIQKNMGRIQRWKDMAQQLPGMVMIQLQKADDIADAMKLRGYGKLIPRGVGDPTPFTVIHLLIMVFISLSFIFIYSLAQV